VSAAIGDELTIADSARVREMVEVATFQAQGLALREGHGSYEMTLQLRDGQTVRVAVQIELGIVDE
jgi:hypothetical protein